MRKRLESYVNVKRLRAKYHRTSPKKKTQILNEISDLSDMPRKSIIRILNRKPARKRSHPGPRRIYEPEQILLPLKTIWFASDQMCSKKLKAAIRHWLPFYEQEHGCLAAQQHAQLLTMSTATIDRLLKPIKAKTTRRGLGGTKPGRLLKNQIPIKTNHWDDNEPGFLEADTVAHCGNSLAGDFIWSITFTDIHTTWTENRAIWNKGATGVVNQVKDVETTLPFKIKGFDCDNGSEFLNYHLIRYFADRPKELMVQFTRSRPYHKNDNAHVEQKNWTHVRQLFGYDRFGNIKILALMNRLYQNEWRLYQNHFIPTMKCILKEKINSKYRKKFDKPKTPYERVMICKHISKAAKKKLWKEHRGLNPFDLKRSIEKQLKHIFKYVKVSSKTRKRI